MIKNIFNTPIINLLEKGLDFTALRHRIISENIAHSETPGYKKKEVLFSEVLNSINKEFCSNSVKNSVFQKSEQERAITTIQSVSQRNDGNNVDPDEEMAKLAQNTVFYQTLSEQINSQFNQLRTVITGGRR